MAAEQPIILSIDSVKGGVGKTTLALRIALDWLRTRETPVVVVDADLHGTDSSVLVAPPAPGAESPQPWPLGLLDVLSASCGCDRRFEQWLGSKLKAERGGLPLWGLDSSNTPTLTFLPSMRARDPVERQKQRASMAMHFLGDPLTRRLVAERLETLVRVLQKVLKPGLVIFDNTPFHLHVSQVLAQGLPGRLGRCRCLEVVGPDLPDLLRVVQALPASTGGTRGRSHGRADPRRGVVLSHDLHHGPSCLIEEELLRVSGEAERLRDPTVLHLPRSSMLAMGFVAWKNYLERPEGSIARHERCFANFVLRPHSQPYRSVLDLLAQHDLASGIGGVRVEEVLPSLFQAPPGQPSGYFATGFADYVTSLYPGTAP